MPRISRQSIDEVRQRADIVALIGDYTSLKKSGQSWKGLSPFASEKTPSFYVHPHKGFFYCFSTAQGGDVFRFVMLKEGLGFQDAVERVASRFGIALQYEEGTAGPTREERSLRAQLLALHDEAAALYVKAFNSTQAGAVRDYWTQQRRFDMGTAGQFQIGFAPPDGGDLARALMKAGFGRDALAKSGLFSGTDYSPDPFRWRPKFHGRLMIPIRDIQGRTVAFTARLLPFIPPDPRDPSSEAKYVNSPETEIFHKSQILFNLDKARIAARDDAPIVLVEGQLDAIRAYTCGATTAVASQGTSIGPEHLALIRRYSRRVDALLDADRAGRDAVLRLLPLALRAGVETRVLSVPGGKDPDEYLAGTGPEGWPAITATATSAIAFAVRALLPPGESRGTAQKLEALQSLFEIIGESSSAIVRHDAVEEISRLTAINPTALQREHAAHEMRARHRRRPPTGETTDAAATPDGGTPSGTARPIGDSNEETLLAILLNQPELAHPIAGILNPAWVDTTTPPGILLNRATAEILENQWEGAASALQLAEDDTETSLLARLIVSPGTATAEDGAASDAAAEDSTGSASTATGDTASPPPGDKTAPIHKIMGHFASGKTAAHSALKRGKTPLETANECLARLFGDYASKRLDELTAALATLPADDALTRRNLQTKRSELRKQLHAPPALACLE